MKLYILFITTIWLLVFNFQIFYGQETQIKYLSGTVKNNTVKWEFYCTAGRESGKWTTIPVPSNWELHGFGTYNYGYDRDSLRGKEKGLYKYKFDVPEKWNSKVVNMICHVDFCESLELGESVPTSWTARMWGWFRAATARASFSKRRRRSGSTAASSGRTLRAT